MRAYLAITGTLFGLLFLLHIWRVLAEWSGFNAGTGFVLLTAMIALGLSVWAFRLFGSLGRPSS
jgi:hypothetical protein